MKNTAEFLAIPSSLSNLLASIIHITEFIWLGHSISFQPSWLQNIFWLSSVATVRNVLNIDVDYGMEIKTVVLVIDRSWFVSKFH